MGRIPKKASATMPWAKDQSLPYLVGAHQPGISIQVAQTKFVAGGVVKFADLKLRNMADSTYTVLAFSDAGAISGTATLATRTTSQFVLAGPSAGDNVTLIIFGRMMNQPK